MRGAHAPVAQTRPAVYQGAMVDHSYWASAALLLAAPCVGSFLGVVALRFDGEASAAAGRSACAHCGRTLAWRDLIPLFSWIVARRRCRYCGERLSWFYPAIEVAAFAAALWSLVVLPGWLAWAGAVLGWALLALAVIDAWHLVLPDEITLPLVPAGLAVAWALDPPLVFSHALGALFGFAFVAGARALYARLRGREGIGLGDAKLLAAAGAWVSWQGVPGVLLLAAAGALTGHGLRAWLSGRTLGDRELPFGPYIAGAFWLVWLYGPPTIG